MTADTRFDRDLPAILEDLYLGPSPDYRDEVLATAVRTRQRPSWTFAGRWTPMADIASRPAFAPRVSWPAIATALLIITILLITALFVGSRQRVPAPFGLAANGLIVLALDGDILTADPATGKTTPVVAGPEDDSDPVFSPDGTRIQFRRSGTENGSPTEDLVVVHADGSSPVVATAQLESQPGYVEWAPDSRSLVVEEPDGDAIWRLDATTRRRRAGSRRTRAVRPPVPAARR